ncbi:hypothetical protein BD626DRAFT_570939 [Schizophyllum amplum]|uniref:DUF6589 domain-containing protein n=1 Tax=Schizophyllum amplum TaxID=97359 RepID=A0A550C925_9AGAR|nr:hypothetical protein BD626DRAFT_570939 [Auriculariopsis ampla]
MNSKFAFRANPFAPNSTVPQWNTSIIPTSTYTSTLPPVPPPGPPWIPDERTPSPPAEYPRPPLPIPLPLTRNVHLNDAQASPSRQYSPMTTTSAPVPHPSGRPRVQPSFDTPRRRRHPCENTNPLALDYLQSPSKRARLEIVDSSMSDPTQFEPIELHMPKSPVQTVNPATQTFTYHSLATPQTPRRGSSSRTTLLATVNKAPRKPRKRPFLTKSLQQRMEAMVRRDPLAKALLEAASRKTAHLDMDVDVEPNESLPSMPPLRRVYRARQQKLDLLFWFLEHVLGWTYGELLYYSAHGAGQGMASDTQYHKVSAFFAGQLDAEYCPSRILEMWFSHAYGAGYADAQDMYALQPKYTEMRDMRASLTSFAAQVTAQKLERDAEVAIQRENGLHVALGDKSKASQRVQWSDIGSDTVKHVRTRIQQLQPLLWGLVGKVCARKERRRNGIVAVRQKRPVENVATNVISTMLFSRSDRANLLPIASGILHFGCLAAFDIHRYHSRMGNMASYNTIMRAMRRLAEHSAAEALSYGTNPSTLNILRGDNVHNYHQHRDPGIGFENELKTGYFGALYEAEDYVPVSAFNIEEKRRYVDLGQRRDVDVDTLVSLVDFEHINTVLALQWVQVLTDYIPELAHLTPRLRSMTSSVAAKLQLPVRKTKIHPLGCCSKNEMYYPELRDAHLDLLAQIGQTREQHNSSLVVAGGDGYTFQRLQEMLDMLQFEDNIVDSLEVLLPFLEGWHQEYTSNNEIIENHYGKPLTSDYSTLGHSAAKLGRRRPADLKKFDYAQGAQLMYLVLDARMLDCWRLHYEVDDIFDHFRDKKRAADLPSIDDLFESAKKLTRAYMSLRDHDTVIKGDDRITTLDIPIGEQWDGIIADDSSTDFGFINEGKRAAHLGSKRTKTRKAARAKAPNLAPSDEPQSKGDLALANSRTFMRAAALSRESMRAAAAGDPGRVYEVTKYQLFQFAGSSCTNYTDYLLEKIISYEFESSAELKKALLQISLVNPSGRENHFCHGDLLQEYFNRLLDAVARHKGVDYSDKFLRDVWSRNIYHVAQLKMESMESLGLDKRSDKHTHPSTNPEIRTLLALYKGHQLHTYRAGRVLDGAEDRERFNKGIDVLERKKLPKYINRTASKRGLARRLARASTSVATGNSGGASAGVSECMADGDGRDEPNIGDDDVDTHIPDGETRPDVAFVCLSNDRIFMRPVDFDDEAVMVLDQLEDERRLVSEDDDEGVDGFTGGSDDTLASYDDPMLGDTDDETA